MAGDTWSAEYLQQRRAKRFCHSHQSPYLTGAPEDAGKSGLIHARVPRGRDFADRTSGQYTTAKSERNAVADEGIDEAGGVACLQHPVQYRRARAKIDRGRGEDFGERPPIPRTVGEIFIRLQDVLQRLGSSLPDQGAGVEHSRRNGLNPTIAAVGEVEIDRVIGFGCEVGLEADPCIVGRSATTEARPPAGGVYDAACVVLSA